MHTIADFLSEMLEERLREGDLLEFEDAQE